MRRTVRLPFLALALALATGTPLRAFSQTTRTIPGAEWTRIEVGDLEFDAWVAGPESGELVILLHGFPQTAWAFREQIPALTAAGYRVVAPNQRGYSPGARPAGLEAYAWHRLVEDVTGIADATGHRRFHLVGHDWGGAVAWNTARLHPERVTTLTVLSTPHPAALGAAISDPDTDQSERSSYFADLRAEGTERRLLADGAAPLREILRGAARPEDLEPYLETLGTPEALGAALNWYRALGIPTPNAPRAGAIVSVPTLYVWGTEDGAFGRDAAEATAAYVDAPYRFEALEGVGHWIPEAAADSVNGWILEHLRAGRSPGNDAVRAVERGVDAIGRAAFEGFETMSISVTGRLHARLQSAAPELADTVPFTARFRYERGGRHWHESAWTARGGTRLSFVRVVEPGGGWRLWRGRGELIRFGENGAAVTRGAPSNYAPSLLPYARLRSALGARDSLRWVGEGRLGSAPVVRVAFGRESEEIRLAFDSETGLPVAAETPTRDVALGPVLRTISWADWREVDGLRVPGSVSVRVGDRVAVEASIVDVRVDDPIDPALFEPPAGTPEADSPAAFQPIEIADGVWVVRLWSGPINTYNTMIVEFEDFVAVVEAPLADAFYPVVADAVDRLAGGKPIRTVITTHHHGDHVGGVGAFLANGAGGVAPPGTARFLEGFAARSGVSGATLHGFEGDTLLTDGRRRLRVIDVGPNPHVDEMAIVHVEDAGIVFVADLFAIPDSGILPQPTPSNLAFRDALERYGIRPEKIVPGHGLVGTMEALDRALADTSTARVTTLALSDSLPSRGRLGGVAVRPDGTLVVSNFRASVWEISPDGEVRTLTHDVVAPSGTAIEPTGDVLQAAFLDGTLHRISREGEVSTVAEGLAGPVGLALDADGTIYVAECHGAAIARIGPDGSVERVARGGPLACPNGLVFGPGGALYVTNYSSDALVRVDRDGSVSVFATVGGSNGNAHVARIADRLYVTEIAGNRVWEVLPDGSSRVVAGSGEARDRDGVGLRAGLAHPNGIAVGPDGRTLWVDTLSGPWKGEEPTRIHVRRIDLGPRP